MRASVRANDYNNGLKADNNWLDGVRYPGITKLLEAKTTNGNIKLEQCGKPTKSNFAGKTAQKVHSLFTFTAKSNIGL